MHIYLLAHQANRLVALGLLALLAACSGARSEATQTTINVQDPWVRAAAMTGMPVEGAQSGDPMDHAHGDQMGEVGHGQMGEPDQADGGAGDPMDHAHGDQMGEVGRGQMGEPDQAHGGATGGANDHNDHMDHGHGGSGGNSAAYMALTNTGSAADAIVGAETTVAATVELHTTQMDDNGVMRMRPVTQIDLPPGETVTLAPGGLHVMLMGLQQDLQAGQTVSLTLRLQSGGTLDVAAPVRQP